MTRRLTPREERLCQRLLQSGNVSRAAREAGYSAHSARSTGSRVLARPDVAARFRELQASVSEEGVMLAHDRKVKLSQIARGRIGDYLAPLPVGGAVVFSAEQIRLNPAPVESVVVHTARGAGGEDPPVVTGLRLHDPVRAIAELNRMERIYSEGTDPAPHTVTIREVVIHAPALPSSL